MVVDLRAIIYLDTHYISNFSFFDVAQVGPGDCDFDIPNWI